ncbi:MAG: hypothetical protein D6698_02780, partial [Gammaproteobacteria bacterium]
SAPITGLLVFLWLNQSHEAQLQHERAETALRLEAEKFDRDFDRLTSNPRLEASKRKMAQHSERIAGLESKLEGLDNAAQDGLIQSQKDAQDAREALLSAPPPSLPDPGDPGEP